jgi:predicted peptidase
MEKELADIKRFHHCILLVSKQLNIEDNSYKIVLSAKKKKPLFFHFSVEEKCNYRLFDPEDYQW